MQRPGLKNLAIVLLVASCDNHTSAPPTTTSLGAACVPSAELSASFAGFDYHDVTVDENNATCSGAVCLVNHFQGLTDCPYGQNSNGNPPPPITSGCTVPGTSTPVRPNVDAGQTVNPQCLDRLVSLTVYCSCRCADTEGNTDAGGSYCTCPSGYACTQVVPATQAGAGAYCILNVTAYDSANVCEQTCNPVLSNCTFEPRDESKLGCGRTSDMASDARGGDDRPERRRFDHRGSNQFSRGLARMGAFSPRSKRRRFAGSLPQVARARAMNAEGCSIRDIAVALKVAKSTIGRAVASTGEPA
jgi:hypothetical protein